MTTETYISFEHKTNRVLANRCLKAMNELCGCTNGTIRNPFELASSKMKDGRTLIETIYEDGEAIYNDGWYIVEVQNFMDESRSIIFVALTGEAEKAYNDINWIDNIN